MKKTNFYKVLFLVCFWVVCSLFIVLYDSALLGFESEFGGSTYSFLLTLITVVLTTIIGASILGTIDVLYLSKIVRKKTFGISILIRTAIYMGFILFFVTLAILYIIHLELNLPLFSRDVLIELKEYLLSSRFLMNFIYWGGACIAALFVLQVSEKFGQGILKNFLLGKYHKPKEEERIFLFMDLKSSTTHAERLGHIKYSQLIQDCYYELTDVVLKYHAVIYQYVGDEVVLTWKVKKEFEYKNCIQFLFEIDKILLSRSDYYIDKYGFVPEFKAGIDIGFATVVEVGQIKKELAYHGDVLNTASRIQSKCNDYNARLLISHKLYKNLDSQIKSSFELVDDLVLKGKNQAIKIYRYKS